MNTSRAANGLRTLWLRMPSVFLSSLLICLGSGVLLAFQYQPAGGDEVMRSVEEITTLIPYGFFLRRLHFASGQTCAILAILHTGRYFLKKTYGRTAPAEWTRLALGLAVCLLLLLTGFILKGDAEGVRAGTVLASLLREIPLIGPVLSGFAVGQGNSFFMPPFLLHCLILPPILLLLLGKHIRVRLPVQSTFAATALVLGGWSLIVPMALPALPGDPAAEATGPWLFLGLQAMLMGLPPLLCGVTLPAGLFTLFCVLPILRGTRGAAAHNLLLACAAMYAALSLGFVLYSSIFV